MCKYVTWWVNEFSVGFHASVADAQSRGALLIKMQMCRAHYTIGTFEMQITVSQYAGASQGYQGGTKGRWNWDCITDKDAHIGSVEEADVLESCTL